jgi:hypothetical protein
MQHIDLNADAIESALAAHVSMPGSGVLALLPEAEKARLPLLQEACRRHELSLVGAIFPALVDGQRFRTEGAWLLHFDRMPPHFLLPEVNAGGESAVSRLVGAVREGLQHCPTAAPKPTLFLMFDAMVPNIASVLEGIYLELSNRVEYAGVNAGSESFSQCPACSTRLG